MKSFKQFFTERQSGHSDFFLLLTGDIKLDRGNACKIWEQCGKRSTFRHITDYVGAKFLIKKKKKDLSISALKFSKEYRGIETAGTITLIVEADYEIWWPRDAWTYIGADSMRWMDMNKAQRVTSNVDTSKRIDALNPIIPHKMVSEYYIALKNILKKYPELNDISYNYQFKQIYLSIHSNFLSLNYRPV